MDKKDQAPEITMATLRSGRVMGVKQEPKQGAATSFQSTLAVKLFSSTFFVIISPLFFLVQQKNKKIKGLVIPKL